jgi:hypothetical protein
MNKEGIAETVAELAEDAEGGAAASAQSGLGNRESGIGNRYRLPISNIRRRVVISQILCGLVETGELIETALTAISPQGDSEGITQEGLCPGDTSQKSPEGVAVEP